MRRIMVTLVVASLLAPPLGRSARAEVYQAPSAEPTPEETLMLEYMNRLRADPVADMGRIAPEGGSPTVRVYADVDWNMFRSEMKQLKSAPPLVFDLRLLDSARKHSHYMILNELTHVEEPGKPGFTGKSFGDRVRKAGFKGGGGGENCFRDSPGPWGCHAGFTVDFGKGGPGGMQPGRGHRMNMMNRGFRAVGIGALPNGGRLSVTHNFGSANGRFVGGVVYVDRNGNDFYDVGEGRGDVEIRASDGSVTRTWKSGAYALKLRSKGPVTVTASSGEISRSQSYESGDVNVKFDWAVPQQAELDRADRLIERAGKSKGKSGSTHFKDLVALYMGTRGLGLDGTRTKKIESLAGEVGRELERHRKAVVTALEAGDSSAFKKALYEHRKPYRYTAADAWFNDAGIVEKAARMVSNYEKQAPRLPKRTGRDLVKLLETTKGQMGSADLRDRLDGLVARAKAAAGGQ